MMMLFSGSVSAADGRICDSQGAIPSRITAIRPDGTLLMEGGISARLAGVLWPDVIESRSRQVLAARLTEAVAGQDISWKAATAPDRWGIAGIHLFLREPHAATSFWLQAGIVERGLVPVWPDNLPPDCLRELEEHEDRAITSRLGYWGARAQARRIEQITRAPQRHVGYRVSLLVDVASIRPWRALHFVNRLGDEPHARSRRIGIAIPNAIISKFTTAGDNPRDWRNNRVQFRVIVPVEGLTRLRIDSFERMRKLR